MEVTTIAIAKTAFNIYKVGYLMNGKLEEVSVHQYYGDAQSDAGLRHLAHLTSGKIAKVIELEVLEK